MVARDDLGRKLGRVVDAVADEPGRAGDVEVEKVGGETVGAGTWAKGARSGSEEGDEQGGRGEVWVWKRCSGRHVDG